MKCFYHTDMDGHCAGAIVRRAMRNQEDDGTGFDYIPINYKDAFPFDKISPGERVFIVDFSLQGEGDFKRLLEITDRVVWIDHHKTAIERHADLNRTLTGLRRLDKSGCELAWEYFFPDEEVPRVVELLGDYDMWTFKYEKDTNQLQAGIRLYDTRPESGFWEIWLRPDYSPDAEIADGHVALKYRDNYYAGLVKSWSFPVTFEGHKAIACNAGSVSSQLFDTVKGDYDILIPFIFDGRQWTVSLYARNKDVDVSELAKKYGGGGHKGAAGFQCKELPFQMEG